MTSSLPSDIKTCHQHLLYDRYGGARPKRLCLKNLQLLLTLWPFFYSSLEAKNFSATESAKNLQLPMDSEAEFQLQPSSSREALELLLEAGLDRAQVTNLLAGSSGQRPTSQDRGADQRSFTRSAEEQGSHQSAQGSQFERTLMETLAKFGERLDSRTARVEGSKFDA